MVSTCFGRNAIVLHAPGGKADGVGESRVEEPDKPQDWWQRPTGYFHNAWFLTHRLKSCGGKFLPGKNIRPADVEGADSALFQLVHGVSREVGTVNGVEAYVRLEEGD